VTALPNGGSCSIAVEFNGPFHYVAEHRSSGATIDRLDGPTRLRNVLLQARFPDGFVPIPWREWRPLKGRAQQEEYLRKAVGAVVEGKVRPWVNTLRWGVESKVLIAYESHRMLLHS
jgi:hypothetical protein